MGGLECGGCRCGAVHTDRSNICSELNAMHEGSQDPSKRLCVVAATRYKHSQLLSKNELTAFVMLKATWKKSGVTITVAKLDLVSTIITTCLRSPNRTHVFHEFAISKRSSKVVILDYRHRK